jgi:hypothetical protein
LLNGKVEKVPQSPKNNEFESVNNRAQDASKGNQNKGKIFITTYLKIVKIIL